MATLTDTTAIEILKPAANAEGGILAELINAHQNAYAAFNAHAAEIAEEIEPSAAQEAESRRLRAKERRAAQELVAHRPETLAEVRAKAAYAVLSGEALTVADRDDILRSFL